MKVVEKDYDVVDGFAWIILDDGYTIQACLCGNYPAHNLEIDMDDSGMNWGICADVNHDAFEKYGKDECIEVFAKEIEAIGIKLLNYER